MTLNVQGKPVEGAKTPAVATPEKVEIVLKLYERYGKSHVLYKRGIRYLVGVDKARELLADKDEHDRPIFARFVMPKKLPEGARKLPVVDLTDPAARAKSMSREATPAEKSRPSIELATEEEFSEMLLKGDVSVGEEVKI